jgi:prepilin-type N-terminal cleavage/methylation domain-containing protein
MRRQDGFSLPEVIVAMTVGMVVLLSAFALIDTAGPLTLKMQDTVDATQRGRLALDTMTSELRSQTCIGTTAPVISADADGILFYAYTGDEAAYPEKRRLFYSNGTIQEQVWKGTNAAGTTFSSTPITRTLVSNAQKMTSPATNVFRYYGFTSTKPYQPTVALTTFPLSATDLGKVVKVSISFIVRPDRATTTSKRELTFQGSSYTRTSNPLDPTKGPNCS